MIYSRSVTAIMGISLLSSVATSAVSDPQTLFAAFKEKFNRKYSSEEEEILRFKNFVDNLKIIEKRNAAEKGSATHGVTRFSDLSEKEFANTYLTLDISKRSVNATLITAPVASVKAQDTLVDWSGTYTTDVKDQGYCGSCWAFSAAEQIESDAMRTLGVTYYLSEQQIVDCDTADGGCNGGWPTSAYSYVQSVGGLEEESEYQYTSGTDGSSTPCQADPSKFVVTVTDYTTVSGEAQMASYVQSTGPLSIVVDASTWSTYTSGIMSDCGTSINHAVQAVGVDTGAGYWKVRNSWGPSWGESGYIRLAYGEDMCALSYDPTATSVKLV